MGAPCRGPNIWLHGPACCWEEQLPILQHNGILSAGNWVLLLHSSPLRNPRQACALETTKASRGREAENVPGGPTCAALPRQTFFSRTVSDKPAGSRKGFQLVRRAALSWWHAARHVTPGPLQGSGTPAMLPLITTLINSHVAAQKPGAGGRNGCWWHRVL